ncbi:MAG: hypothetical protein PWP54_1253 [Thermosipho sp. (in: thermotogales)]|nr:hypothetical protein [Thermosipho sp. (in: thermotogales)]MDN5324457.1 hypothetical protein [Thermosipho sp. (in: thermotogales)]
MFLFGIPFSKGYFLKEEDNYTIKWKVENFDFGWKISWSVKGNVGDLEIFKIKNKDNFRVFSFFAFSDAQLMSFLKIFNGEIKILEEDDDLIFKVSYEQKFFEKFTPEESFVMLNFEDKLVLLNFLRNLLKKENEQKRKSKLLKLVEEEYLIANNIKEVDMNLKGKVIILNDFIDKYNSEEIQKLRKNNLVFAKSRNYLENISDVDGFIINGDFEEIYLISNITNLILLDFEDNFDLEWKNLFRNVHLDGINQNTDFVESIVKIKNEDNYYIVEYLTGNEKVFLKLDFSNKKYIKEKIPFININKNKVLRDDGRIFNFYGGDEK